MIRPENIKISVNPLKDGIPVTIKDNIYDGSITKLVVNIQDDLELKVNTHDNDNFQEETIAYIKFDKDTITTIKGNKK